MADGGKGSTPRPLSVSNEEYASRWDAIFQRDLPKEDDKAIRAAIEELFAEDQRKEDEQ